MSILLQKPSPPEPKGIGLVDTMRAAFRSSHRRNSSLSTVPPPQHSSDYSPEHASIAASILYRSPLPSQSGLPIYILNAAAFPDAFEVDYDTLLAYVLARLPGEEQLIAGTDYEVIFFAGGQPESATSEKKTGPGIGWYLQTYHVLSRAVRKRLSKLYVVHERSWVRILIEVFGTIVSPKFKKKIIHCNTLSGLAMHMPIEKLLIPPSVYLHDRRVSADIYAPYVSGRRAFGADEPLPVNFRGERRLPRVLRETTTFLCRGHNLKTEGLFRIPPHSQLSAILREAYDRGQKFIVFKEGPFMWAQPGMPHSILKEVGQADTYGIHLAAGLIKLWYRELKKPIFEESCYPDLRDRFGAVGEAPALDDLVDLVSPASAQSCLTAAARLILTTHLLPLLFLVTSEQSSNKMSGENLAICFAPTMVCGSDQLADAKMTSIIRRILEAAIEQWPNGLREACNTAPEAFAAAIDKPKDPQDYEDPLHHGFRPASRDSSEESQHRILLRDDDSDYKRPPLPPRPRASSRPNPNFPIRQDSLSSPVKRKPAPASSILPRYSASISPGNSERSSPVDASFVQKELIGFDGDEKAPTRPSPTEQRAAPTAQTPFPVIIAPARRPQNDLMKELKNSLSTDIAKRKPVSSPVTPPSPVQESPEKPKVLPQRSTSGDNPTTSGNNLFVRPTWAASTRQVSAPMYSQQNSSSSAPSTQPTTPSLSTPGNLAAPPPAFKARTPSPGLLKRMTSMEVMKKTDAEAEKDRLLPKRLGLKQASVDDLRRLYEVRAGTARTLSSASSASRRSSNVDSLSRRTSNASLM